jgi:antitoxin component YwqK of YwqJK toxin-antitoxin module
VLDGSLILYHKRGGKFEDLVFDNGRLDRVNGLYTYTGQRLKVGSFAESNGRLFRYYPNGLLFAEENYKNGNRHDSAVYYDNKIPSANGNFVEGKPKGLWTIKSWDHAVDRYYVFDSLPGLDFVVVGKHFDHGERVEGFLRGGEADGTWTSYNTYNEPVEIMNYKDGVPHGSYYKYLGASKLEEGEFVYGQRHGVWNYYNMSKQIDFKEVFQSDVTFDSAWNKAPEPNYRLVFDGALAPEHPDPYEPLRVKEWVADIPGTELIKTFSSPYRVEPNWILVKRDIPLVEAPDWKSARFEGGNNAKLNFFRENTILDANILKGDTIHGLVMVRFKVDAFGFLSDLKVVKGMGYGVDEAVLSTYRKMPPWRPAQIQGIRVDSYRVEAIYF